jgi:hypothetical protein
MHRAAALPARFRAMAKLSVPLFACTSAGKAEEVASYLERFAADTGADELMTVHYSGSVPNRLRSVELVGSTC